jgi:hypothetical protein
MNAAACIAGILIVLLVLRDIFDGILVAGRVHRRLRFIPYYFHWSWGLWAAVGRRIRNDDSREKMLMIFGPLAMIGLLALWALGLMMGFALLQAGLTPGHWPRVFLESMYSTGARMFTAGVGDWAKDKPASKVLVVVVSATGLGFFTMVITYLPVLYQLFSRRETHVILLDERAGSPVTSMSLIQNHARRNAIDRLDELLEEWEKWSAELLESHVSYPMLSYYRSQHSDESWLAAMAVIMDTCALRLAGAVGIDEFQAESTLSMCVNALHSIAGILCIKPLATYPDRLTKDRFYALTDKLRDCRLPAGDGQTWSRLSRVRDTYEPLLAAMADYFIIPLPEWIPSAKIEAPLEAAQQHR